MTLPDIHPIEKIRFPSPEKFSLANGVDMYGFNGTKNDILRIDMVFDSGRWTEPAKLVAESAGHLFKSGTAELSSFQLSERIDFYGSTIKAAAGYNTFNVSLYCMNRFLEPSLELLVKCLTEIIFPEKEIDLYKKNSISKLKVSQEKNDYLSDVLFKHAVYGKDHPYGYETTEACILDISQQMLRQFYSTDLSVSNCTLFIAGKYGEKEQALIDQYLGSWKGNAGPLSQEKKAWRKEPGDKKNRLTKEKSVQASIIIGKDLFNKHEEDYASFILLNTIFGGYFGSRLMSNIREDKGLTYGIYSGLATLKHGGIFTIQTETNVDTLEVCLREIYNEIDRLQKDVIPEPEISLARNYLLGKFLSRTDGPFSQVEVFKNYFIEGMDIHKFEKITETIRATDAVALQRLAQKYFLKDSLYEAIVA
jgi:predicted Zn-dependent peptidase